MEKQMVLTGNKGLTGKCIELSRKLTGLYSLSREALRQYYSHVLERDVDGRQTNALIEVQLAFFATVLPMDYPLLLRFAACAWFVTALIRCKAKFGE